MNILLIYPSSKITNLIDFPPLGILYVASALREHGHEVCVWDSLPGKGDPELLAKVRQFEPRVVGISSNTLQISEGYRLAKLLKSEKVSIVMGGVHVSVRAEEILRNCEEIDFCVIGEGEKTIAELVAALDGDHTEFGSIPGLAYRANRTVVTTARRELIDDIDAIPFPARELVEYRRYRSYPVMSMITSRGCPFRCTFCVNSVFGRSCRQRSVESVLEEVGLLIDRFGCQGVDFHDDTFNLHRGRAKELVEGLIAKGYHEKITWSCEARVNRNMIDRELVRRFKESGCRLISFGIESGSERILKVIRKDIQKNEVRNAVALCREEGIATRGFFMVGHESETLEDAFESIRFAQELRCSAVQFTVCTPFPGCDYYAVADAKGWIRSKDYSVYNERNALTRNENLNAADLVALKNVADFLMLIGGNNLEIFATMLCGTKKTFNIRRDSFIKVLRRIPEVRHPFLSAWFLFKYLLWVRNYKRRGSDPVPAESGPSATGE